ncbi:DUF4136 domain-containing protein [Mucisphaera calidilacus]|uniref:DUF4136 domain-containing protein n=1 Tax=Mucisphaera calidilacus TaxID=2527982 RepID=A0A518BYH5_9BACT|nr:DUF4136 domain-containing protein [Mucisphaera calidilacus]QDU72022.1 hypothetical protein Pan265_18820 [Mucisphaera calidilacus]
MLLKYRAGCFLLMALCLLVVGCQSTSMSSVPPEMADIQIQTETNPRVNLSGYSTYAWGGAAAALHDPDDMWTPPGYDVGRVSVMLIEKQLTDLGLTKASQDPDMLIFFAIGVDMKSLGLETSENPDATLVETPAGGLLVIAADPGTRQVMWAGVAVAELLDESERTPELAQKRMHYAVGEIFKSWPAKPKS